MNLRIPETRFTYGIAIAANRCGVTIIVAMNQPNHIAFMCAWAPRGPALGFYSTRSGSFRARFWSLVAPHVRPAA